MQVDLKIHKTYSLIAFVLVLWTTDSVYSKSKRYLAFQQEQPTTKQDTTKADSLRNLPYAPSRKPTFNPSYRFGDPFSNSTESSPLLLKDPSTLNLDVEIDTSLNYTIYEKIGDLNYRPTSSMSFDEFNRYQDRQILKSYWKNRSAGLDGESAVSGRNIIPPIYVSPLLDRIFGGSYVEIIPRGFVTLDFGARWQRVDNPVLPIRQQRNGGFEFDQQISMNVTGKIGEKLQVTANFDNNNSFDFENNLKVEFTGFEEDIIKKLEIGNISLPLNNSLISGAQNLFGIKAQMQFGKLFVTSVASTQRGKTQSVTVGGTGAGGGGSGRQFEILAADYDENRHFFLGHFFRDQYEEWLENIPQVFSGINIRRVEVYVLNRQNNTQTLRNVVGLMDLGEPNRIYNSVSGESSGEVNDNDANNLYDQVRAISDKTEVGITESLKNLSLENGLDFEKISGARKLDENEYTVHPLLGYLSLNRKLQNDEALAVSYEYTYNGQNYQVGQLSDDYANTPEDQVIFMKLLRPRKINIKDNNNIVIPTWDLMMKNIYYLNANQIEQSGFDLRIIYRDDQSGNDQPSLQDGTNTPIIELLGLDKLNSSNDIQKDGNFDFVDGLTVDIERGLVMFPFLEPFNTPLANSFAGRSDEDFLRTKYVYDTLYRTTRADARQIVEKNKYFITGSMQSGSSSEINLTGFNVSEGSVRVFAGGIALVEGRDFQVDYTFGKVRITNQGILNSGKQITVNYETADLFNFQSRTLMGSRFDYKLNEGVNFGATLLYLNERPLISRIQTGNEPARNLKYGLDVNIQKESRMLTKLIDLMPVIQTKVPSSINFSAEFAQLKPGTSNKVNGESTSYIDDFESSATPFGLGNPTNWKLAATPQTIDNRFTGELIGDELDDLRLGHKRAKMAWYQVDNLFYRSGGINNPDLSDDQLDNHYSRAVSQQEIFPFRGQVVGNNNEPIFNISYFPRERGPYNYTTNLDSRGSLSNPKDNWGGITQAIRTEVDFDNSNVEYLEFWMLDPFIDGEFGLIDDGINAPKANTTGGEMIFHLGSISEDIVRDGRHAFENGLPSDGLNTSTVTNNWGRVTTQQYLTNAFDNNGNRSNQDVGLDGIKDEDEASFYNDFVNGLSGEALNTVLDDVSADNFQYFLSYPQEANIVERYKNFNGHDGNSPISDNSSFTPTGSTTPDNEDLNSDNTLSELEEYFEYRLDITPSEMQVGRNHIVDQIIADNPNGKGQDVTWYLFRIPIRQPDTKFGNIRDFKSIKYMRTILTGFEDPVVLRLANFRMVGSQWRRYTKSLEGGAGSEDKERDPNNLTISVVNIEENSQGNATQSPYVLPPGINRDRDNTSTIERSLNEQSLQLCVNNLEDNDARAAFKDQTLDLINYGRLKMFLHADSPDQLEDGAISAFVRLGRDDDNYYEIEVPLKITPPSTSVRSEVWPSQNEIDIAFEQLYKLKKERIENGGSSRIVYPRTGGKPVGNHRITVLGNPVINDVSRIMIGVRNVKSDDKSPITACIWANEMRVTDFDSQAGWATNATFNAKLADLGNITASTRYTSVGFGSVQSKISERTRDETTTYDIAASINLDKFLPEKAGLKIPMYASYEKTNIKPKWDPASPDLTVDESLVLIDDGEERSDYKVQVQDNTIRRSINFTNVQKIKTNPEAKKHIYDIENFSFTYAYSDIMRRNYSISEFLRQNYKGAVGYSFSPEYDGWSPLAESKKLKSPYFKWLKEFNFNPIPNNITVRADLDRQFIKTIYRNREGDQPNFEKFFNFNRTYNMKWNITKSLTLDYNARAHSVIDEPEGEINSDEKRDVVWDNIKNLGRLRDFNQDISANYKLPLDKLPLTDWMNADYRYSAGYTWTAATFIPDTDANTGVDQTDLDFGGIIENNRGQAVTGKFDMVKLYNKVKVLKQINTPPRRSRANSRTQAADTVKTIDDYKLAKGFLRTLMMVRSINATYNLDEGTLLPGFTSTPFLFGVDSSFNAPGIPFILGSQDADIRKEAAANGWIVDNPRLTNPFSQSRSINFNLKANIEPFKDFKIQIDATKRKSSVYQEIFRYDTIQNEFGSLSPSRGGSYTVSFFTLGTAFSKDDDDNNSPIFQDFEDNRTTILSRLNGINNTFSYDTNSQDVLIPAFIAAYTGKAASDVTLSPFPKTPVPNWRFDYTGLSKIPALKDIFSSVSITHSYKSSYTVGNYINSPEYGNTDEIDFNTKVEDYNNGSSDNFASEGNDDTGLYIPRYIIGQVLISEQFAPLIGVNLRTKGRATIKVEYKKQRDLSLQLTNNQVTEMRSNDLVLEYGFTKANFKLPFKSQGRVITLKNDLQFRMSITIRDTRTVQRKLEEINTVTNGNINYQLRPNINYVLNKKLNLQIYFERSINEPKISTSFKRTTTSFGFQLRFSLAQ